MIDHNSSAGKYLKEQKDIIEDAQVPPAVPPMQPDCSTMQESGRDDTSCLPTVCFGCPAGYYQTDEGSTFCLPCLTGTYQNQLASPGCKNCPIGYSNGGTEALECTDCRAGKFQNEEKKSSCKDCGAGTYSEEKAATADTVCLMCIKGTYSTMLGAETEDVCTSCAPGKWSNKDGASLSSMACKDCELDHFSADEGRDATCEKCPSDSTTKEKGQTICLKCDAGLHMNTETDGSKSCRAW